MERTMAEAIETLVDNATLSTVVDTLVDICHGKAEHLRGNWQDEFAAKAWERAGRRLDTVREIIAQMGL